MNMKHGHPGEFPHGIEPLWGWAVALALLAVAAAFRVPGVMGHIFDQDELYTLVESTHLFSTTLEPGIEARPVYYLLQHALLGVVPHTEIGLRILPMVFGLAGVLLTWWIATRLAGRTAGLMAGILVAAAPWHVYVSSTARYYSLVYLLAAGFFYCFLRAARDSNGWKWHVSAVTCLILGASTHPTFVFPAFAGSALVVVAAWALRRLNGVSPWRLIGGVAVPFAVFLSIAFGILVSIGRETAVRNLEGRGITAVLNLIPGVIEWISPLLLVAALVASFGLLRHSSRTSDLVWSLMALGGIIGTLVILFVAALVTNSYPYYATAMLPLIFVTLGVGIARLTALLPTRRGWAAAALVVILLAGISPGAVSQLTHGTKFDYRPALEQARAETDGDLVLAWPIIVQRYYAPDLRSREFRPNPDYLAGILAAEGSFWAIASRRRHGLVGDAGDAARRWLSRECEEVNSFQGRRFDFRLYEVILYRCGTP